MEQLSPKNRWFPFVSVDPDRLGGTPVFKGTRVPVQTLFDYLKAGHDLAMFLDHFEGVTPVQARAVLELAAGGAAADIQGIRAA